MRTVSLLLTAQLSSYPALCCRVVDVMLTVDAFWLDFRLSFFPPQLKEYQQKNSPGATAGAKKKRKAKEGSRPETPTNDDRQSPENVSVPPFLPDNPSASCVGFPDSTTAAGRGLCSVT